MQKYFEVTIYDKQFKVYHSINQARCVPYLPAYPSLYDVYDTPSEAKVRTWNEWCKWFKKMGSNNFGVYSYNNYYYTIGGTVEFLGAKFYVYISYDRKNRKDYNLLFPIEY